MRAAGIYGLGGNAMARVLDLILRTGQAVQRLVEEPLSDQHKHGWSLWARLAMVAWQKPILRPDRISVGTYRTGRTVPFC